MKKTKPQKSATKAKTNKKVGAENFLVVGIGASAGGIEALRIFFENVSADSGMAYVVILHLSPDHDSQLASVLRMVAKIPVDQVTEKVTVKPNHVYVVPPNQSLKMIDGSIIVEPIHTIEERRAPVDIFFRTLAESHCERAVAVVLSGTGANGSMGMKRVKECGGVVFVQNPREAEYSDMPRNSIATDLVDAILNVGEIPAKITAYRQNIGIIEIPVESESRPDDDQAALREIFMLLRVRTGHDFSNYKRATVLRRIERRINVRQLSNLPAYTGFLRENPEEAQALLKALLISVTNFFRDKEAFYRLESEVLPKILDGKTAQDQIRVWVAGCATGEEAYSLAMLIAEKTLGVINTPKIQIFASDIDDDAIAVAREGLYSLNDAADISSERLRRFFNQETDGFRVRREIREMVLFANHNVIKDPPFSRLDLVTCRNLLIYLNQSAQERVMETIHFALKPGGFMFLGSSESIDGATDLYAPVSKEFNIFQSRQTTARPLPVPDAALVPTFRFKSSSSDSRALKTLQEQEIRSLERISFADLHQQLLEQYAPPSIVINENYDIVHLSEHAGRFLQISGGEPSNNLLNLIRQDLGLELRAALYQAVQKRTNIEAKKVKVQIEERVELINLHIRPVLDADDPARGFFLVVFEPTDQTSDALDIVFTTSEPIARHLEEELTNVKSQLRSSIEQFEIQTEELRASNEELQAMNEELRSTAEELETSKEELQSVNEELITVNQELKIKIEELLQSNNDFRNLMNSTDIGTVFLDRNFRVKMFTPPAREVFNLIPADYGRPLSDITSRIEHTDLIRDAETVLEKLQTIEREIQIKDGRTFLMQISPYRTGEDRINGIVIAFVNITRRKKAEESIRFQAQLLNLVEQAVIATDVDGKVIFWNRFAETVYGWTAGEAIGRPITKLTTPEMKVEQAAKIMSQLRQGKSWIGEFQTQRKDGSVFTAQVFNSPIRDEQGILTGIVGVSVSSTERKQTEEALRESETRFRLLVESVTDYAIFTIDENMLINSWNTGAENVFGFQEREIIGKSGALLFTPEDRRRNIPEAEVTTALEKGRAEDERWHIRKDGSRFFASGVMQPLQSGKVNGFVKIARDMTDKIEAEKIKNDREILQKLVSAQEDERKRLARDLHDELGQQLTALRLKLEATRELCDQKEICRRLDEMQLIAKHIDADVDFLAWELRPVALDDLGLIAALENYVSEWSRHAGILAEFHAPKSKKIRFASEVETNFYRITQEALNNIYKHANAKFVSVMLEERDDLIVLIIEDDGIGFNLKSRKNQKKGLGLIGMNERATLVGGSFEIESIPKQGTTIYVRVPASFNRKEKKNV